MQQHFLSNSKEEEKINHEENFTFWSLHIKLSYLLMFGEDGWEWTKIMRLNVYFNYGSLQLHYVLKVESSHSVRKNKSWIEIRNFDASITV